MALPQFFLGTDTAPHTADTKECACGCAGTLDAPERIDVPGGDKSVVVFRPDTPVEWSF